MKVRIHSEEERITSEKSRIDSEQNQMQINQSQLDSKIQSSNFTLHEELQSWQEKSDLLDQEIESLYQQIKLKQHQKLSISNTIQEIQQQIRIATQPFLEDLRKIEITKQLLSEHSSMVFVAETNLNHLRQTLEQTLQSHDSILAIHDQEISQASIEIGQLSSQLKSLQQFFEQICNSLDFSLPEVFQEYSS